MRNAAAWAAGLLALALVLVGYGSPAGAATRSVGGPLASAGFVPAVQARVGVSPAVLVLGNGPCGSHRCLELYEQQVGLAPMALRPPPSPMPTTRQPSGDVDFLVFANRLDGYAIERPASNPNVTVVYATTDGTRTWQLVSFGAHASVFTMIAAGGRFYAVVVRCTGPSNRPGGTCDGYRLARSPVGTTAWSEVALPGTGRLDGDAVGLTATGSTVWLTYEAQVAGAEPMLLRSAGGAGPFAVRPQPQLVSVTACDLTAEPGGVLWAACPTGMMVSYLHSTDAGRHFEPFWDTAGTGGAVFDPTGPAVAYRYTGIGGPRPYVLQRTTDGGARFDTIGPLPRSFRPDQLVFVNARDGFAFGWTGSGDQASPAIVQTTDGGRTWGTLSR